ncbi:MAG: pirin family protein [Rhodospirillales bacterium]
MIDIRPAHERGAASLGWLDSKHTFSFGQYHDPRHMGFATLRVINEDWVQPGGGFDTHGHRDMEIVTYVLDGALEHKDSLGTGSVIRPGDVQRMTAGSGIRHSEFNHSNAESVHLLQIWILPEKKSLTPGYEQKNFPGEEKRGRLRLIASRDGRDGSVTIHQDTDLYATLLKNGENVTYTLPENRKAWIQVARGSLALNGAQLAQGDGAAIAEEDEIIIESTSDDTEVLLFDMK